MVPHTRNRLAAEPSLYLRQHASNPVDWYPWGEPALARARSEDRPILLSIGYSACHWCHVMERECFESEVTAELMNRLFVCIKVDREERPDLDAIYMKAVQGMTGRGGWPMTVFLTPQLLPFYAGTYFPPEDRGGLPGFPRVLGAVARAFREERDRVRQTSERVGEFLRSGPPAGDRVPDRESLANAGDRLLAHIDREHGGFGTAPKFPNAGPLGFLLGLERETPRATRAAALRTTLDRMMQGGMYDQLGGGFHRYSVDRAWTVPHFEKMLYDQASLADLYREAWLRFRDDAYRKVALETLEYVVREMTAADGGFYATQDADSEDVEGKFFIWTKEDVERFLPAAEAKLLCSYFGIGEKGNFDGANVLQRRMAIEEIAETFGVSVDRAQGVAAQGRRTLLEARRHRVAPVTDRKILTDWNGLMIGSMAAVGRLFGRADLIAAAERAALFVTDVLWADGRLRHFHAEGSTRVDAFLDDHAFFGRACVELFAATSGERHLRTAERCAETLLETFIDSVAGGFFFTAYGDQTAISREKNLDDGAVPSGNAVATELMLRLHAITGDARYANAAEASLAAWGKAALDNPYSGAQMLAVAHRAALGYGIAVVAEAGGGKGLLEAALTIHAPELTVLSAPAKATTDDLAILAGKEPTGGRDTVYLCRGTRCSAPIHDAKQLEILVGEGATAW